MSIRMRARCANSSDGPIRPSSNPSTYSMMMTGGSCVGPELEDADDAAIGEERHRARFAQELADAGGRARIAPDDLAGDDAIERQVAQLEDLAHAARAEPFDGLEAGELRPGLIGRRRPRQRVGGRAPVRRRAPGRARR